MSSRPDDRTERAGEAGRVLSLADRLRLVRALGDAGATVVAALGGVLLVASLVPAATAVALAFLVGRLDELHRSGLLAAAVAPLAVFGAVVAAEHLLGAAVAPLTFLARSRIDGRHRARVTHAAATSPRIDALERPEVQVLVREALADRSRGYDCTPADGAIGQLRWATSLTGAAAAGLVIAAHAWWLVPVILVPALLNRMVRSRLEFGLMLRWKEATKGELHADVWRRAAVSPSEGKDVRIFGFAEWMTERMQHIIRVSNAGMWRHINRMIGASWKQLLLAAGGLLPAYVVVAVSAARGDTSIAVATAVLAASAGLFQALSPTIDMYHIVGAVRVLKAFDELGAALGDGPPRGDARQRDAAAAPDGRPPDAAAGVQALRPPPDTGRAPLVRFERVSFGYPGRGRPVLDGVDLEIRPGELLAIVGLNGAGKSTLTKLLAGLYAPDSGRITADGVDLAGVEPAAWRSRIAVVFQDFVQYRLSAADNVSLGQARAPADRRLVESAARDAGLDRVVRRLPFGWDTPLSRACAGGVDLSGGQWQQVVLARALYAVGRGARLLVLDEPTAHLDVRTEFEVFGRLAAHRGETSVVLISHRLSSVRRADRIVVLEGGRITESGSHAALLRLGGAYARMFAIQAERFRRGHRDPIEDVAIENAAIEDAAIEDAAIEGAASL